jgi:hypothetical protein
MTKITLEGWDVAYMRQDIKHNSKYKNIVVPTPRNNAFSHIHI